MVLPFFQWAAPAWTGAGEWPQLYRTAPRHLMQCVLVEEALPRLQAAADREAAQVDPFSDPDPRYNARGCTREAQAFLQESKQVLGAAMRAWRASQGVESALEALFASIEDLVGPLPAGTHVKQALERVRGFSSAAEARAAVEHLLPAHARWREARRDYVRCARRRRSLDAAVQRLEQGNLVLLARVQRLVGLSACRIPRAAPGEPPRGELPLTVTMTLSAAGMVHVLARADTFLETHPDSPLAGEVRAGRQALADAVASALQATEAVEADLRGLLAWTDLVALCVRIVQVLGLADQDFRVVEGNRVLALELLVRLEQLGTPQAAKASQRLQVMLSLAPLDRPVVGSLDLALQGFRGGGRKTLEALERLLDRLEARE